MFKLSKIEKSWALYDWGNSAYSMTVTSTILPLYFKAVDFTSAILFGWLAGKFPGKTMPDRQDQQWRVQHHHLVYYRWGDINEGASAFRKHNEVA
jgi:hypothetical protein